MPSVFTEFAIAFTAGGAVCVLLFAALARLARRVRQRRRFARGLRGQADGAQVLERCGYKVIAEEHAIAGELEVDGECRPYEVRVDYLVRSRRRVYAVEVKTGRSADALQRQTRRQLREYAALLGVDGLLLLDMEARVLHTVRFPELTEGAGAKWSWVVLAFAAGAGAALVARLLL